MPADYIIEQPTLCMVVGVPGSGKTALAKELTKAITDAVYVSKDMLQDPFTPTERVSGKTYSLIHGPAFEIMVDFADISLYLGKRPIVEGPFSVNAARKRDKKRYREWIRAFKDTANKYDARLAIVRCVPPSEEELRRRIEEGVKRGEKPRDKWKLRHWAEFRKREPFYFPIDHDDIYEFVSDRPVIEEVGSVLYYLHARRSMTPKQLMKEIFD